MWVVYGVPYYGTGWYYPPYWYGGYYYPYYGSYGYGSWYNPVTGGFGSRSVWYGPYGGYSYTQGYNARTGRYGIQRGGLGWQRLGAIRREVQHAQRRIYGIESRLRLQLRLLPRGTREGRSQRRLDDDGSSGQSSRTAARR